MEKEMTKEELFFENETRKHQQEVSDLLIRFAQKLLVRAQIHDASKLHNPERDIFIEYTPKLKGTTYGSPEYKKYLKEMKVALDHHYSKNPHHPECYQADGIDAMNLMDIVEMLFDWYAATKRHADGNIFTSINKNEERFEIKSQLSQIFRNTIALFEPADAT